MVTFLDNICSSIVFRHPHFAASLGHAQSCISCWEASNIYNEQLAFVECATECGVLQIANVYVSVDFQ